MFLVRGDLVATQPECQPSFIKPEYREVRHFFCVGCGEVWGMRVPLREAKKTIHLIEKSKCSSCGGANEMLLGYEWNDLSLVGEEVVAYHLLKAKLPEGEEDV